MQRVGVVFGGRSVEHRVSVQSARTVAAALRDAGYEVVALGIAEDGCWVDGLAARAALDGEVDALAAAGGTPARSLRVLLQAQLDVVFPLVHGTRGEDGSLQGLCEMVDLPYVGAGVATSAVCMDKVVCKRILASVGLPVVDYEEVVGRQTDEEPKLLERLGRLGLPLFVKPSCGGSSVGVRRVERPGDLLGAIREALRFDDRALVEVAISGRELECSVLGDAELKASVVGEIVPGNLFYDYQDKYLQDEAKLVIPAGLDQGMGEQVRRLAASAFAAVGGWGMARVDFLLDAGGRIYINEINTLPGFTRISMYPKLWEASGLPLSNLVHRLVEIALTRHRERTRLDESIRSWLAELG